ncbi:hypothetical protein JTB14_028940 [Gonioctena quinquepunctata]|nr:hypothetical protein JTB14_028940 [Gonioctena quinquepunctata]
MKHWKTPTPTPSSLPTRRKWPSSRISIEEKPPPARASSSDLRRRKPRPASKQSKTSLRIEWRDPLTPFCRRRPPPTISSCSRTSRRLWKATMWSCRAGSGNFIQPTRTDRDYSNDVLQTSDEHSGEANGAPHQARSLPLQESQISPSATMMMTSFASRSPQQDKGRQASPDIQDIITGLVKLLNGNVNVQANTGPGLGRPLRPLSTRINNRGPPRITDLPALPPDFDVPAPLPPPLLGQMPPPLTTTRLPTPYPFDLPNMSPVRPFTGAGTSIPISDQSPMNNKRPGFYRPPTIPPWRRKRPPNRRPPQYKPMPSDMVSLTSERPMEDVLTLDLGSHLIPEGEGGSSVEETGIGEQVGERNSTEVVDSTTDGVLVDIPEVDKEIAEFEKNKEKISKLDKYTSKTTIVTPTFNPDIAPDEPTMATEPLPTKSEDTEVVATPTLKPESSSSSVVSSSDLMTNPATASAVVNEAAPVSVSNTSAVDLTASSGSASVPQLESSIQEVSPTVKESFSEGSTSLAGTETEKLPETSLVLESSSSSAVEEVASPTSTVSTTSNETPGFPYYPYRPRPGIVLDDTEYKPGGINRQPIVTRPVIGQIGDIFDITVSAIQGPGGGASAGQGKPYVIPVDIEQIHMDSNRDVITSPVGDQGFVSIDGKRTHFNLFGDGAAPSTSVETVIKPTAPAHNQVSGTGYAVVENEKINRQGSIKPTARRPIYGRPRPSQPPVRIDTCIVGDDSTCDASQHEICKTELGVSACHCRPGTARRKHRDPCRKIVSILLSLRVDKLYDRKVVWANELGDSNSDSYQQLSYEAERALESAMSMTPFSDEFLAAKVNGIYRGDRSQGQAGVLST